MGIQCFFNWMSLKRHMENMKRHMVNMTRRADEKLGSIVSKRLSAYEEDERELELLQKQFGWPEPQWLKSLVKWKEENQHNIDDYYRYGLESEDEDETSNSDNDDSPKLETAVEKYLKGLRSKARFYYRMNIAISIIQAFYFFSIFFSPALWRNGPPQAILSTSEELSDEQQSAEEDEKGDVVVSRGSNGFPTSGGDENSSSTDGSDGKSPGGSLAQSRGFCFSLVKMSKILLWVIQPFIYWYLVRAIANKVNMNRIKVKIASFVLQILGRIKSPRSLPNPKDPCRH